jgi:hypothetical protein
LTTGEEQLRVGGGCAVIEGQNALVKVLVEHAAGRGFEYGSTSSSRKHRCLRALRIASRAVQRSRVSPICNIIQVYDVTCEADDSAG